MANLVRVAAWEQYGWLRHGFSTRMGGVSFAYDEGDLNLGYTRDDDAEAVRENRRLAVAAAGGGRLVTMRQVHSASIAVASEAAVFEGDGLMTAQPGLLLGVLTADCVPVLVVDTAKRVVAAFHAGWRGTVAGIAERGVARMAAEFGSRPEDLVAAVGPSIGPCCYEVGDEVRSSFDAAFGYADSLFEGRRLDLWEANRRQLAKAGVSSITVIGVCSACSRVDGRRKYFSHRAEAGKTGRMMALVGIGDELDELPDAR